jgi:hypothetical protein
MSRRAERGTGYFSDSRPPAATSGGDNEPTNLPRQSSLSPFRPDWATSRCYRGFTAVSPFRAEKMAHQNSSTETSNTTEATPATGSAPLAPE